MMVVELLELEKDWNVDDIVAGFYVNPYVFFGAERKVCTDSDNL